MRSSFLIFIFILFSFGIAQASHFEYAIDLDCDHSFSQNLEFKEVKNSLINEGIIDGCIVLKISKITDNKPFIIKFPYERLQSAASSITKGSGKIELLSSERYVTFHVEGSSGSEAQIKLSSSLASFIPIETYSTKEYALQESKNQIGIGLYFGFAIAMFLLNLVLFFYFGDRLFLVYGLILIFISMNILFEDGLLKMIVGSHSVANKVASLFHWLVPLFFSILVWEFANVNRYYPRLKYVLGALIIINVIFYISFHITGQKWLGAFGDTTAIIILSVIFITVITLWKKSELAKIIIIAYSFILACTIDIYIPRLMGINMLNVTHAQVKLGGLIEMVVFLLALIYRMNKLKEENIHFKEEINRMLIEIQNSVNDNQESVNDKISRLGLTGRQLQILNLIRKGNTNKEIASEMNISINTVKFHIKNIYEKLGIQSRTEIIAA